MATKKKTDPDPAEVPLDAAGRPRLHKLVVRNFRSIGVNPVEIELDDIVVLVGPNNAGKSSILRAYEVVMKHGSKECHLIADDFPCGVVDPTRLPEVELQTIVSNRAPGDRWIETTSEGELLIREKWTWDSPNKAPVRRGYDVEKSSWDEQVPWGAPNVANARRPLPHRIDAFASPDVQASAIASLIADLLRGKVAAFKSDPGAEKSDYALVIEKIRDLQTNVVSATEDEVRKIEREISAYLTRVFPGHKVKVDPKPETDVERTFSPFKSSPEVLMGTDGGYFSSIAHQGSGARRTLLWAALRYLKESEDAVGSRPHVLLLDEPEICLHPSAIREARTVLYDLPTTGRWQVMLTSHSPIFIDLSRDNTTVVRVFRGDAAAVQATTLYRPRRAKLSDDDKRNMKLLNICDPYLHEFFFGGRQVIVEGDTEYTAFSMLREVYPDEYSDLQVIRARGKGVIPSVARVLLQFSTSFSILHDTDGPKTASGGTNPAWSMNSGIADILSWPNAAGRVHLVACKPNFEVALFGQEVRDEKPYSALVRIRTDATARSRVKALLDGLLDSTSQLPQGCIRWSATADLV